ncbi:hypothetical protein V5O48_015800 [Marasmius crinis-equi]|uniref:Uncharacterized protein n=1 Tax=Marasmius crinis-equi TaxID=585013 RepID=A0ABR3ETT9_9AGAR
MSTSFFPNAHDFTVEGGTFNSVGGDQVNQITQIIRKKKKKRTEYDEFRVVKRGDICRLRSIHTEHKYEIMKRMKTFLESPLPGFPKVDIFKRDGSWDEGRQVELEADRTICAAEVSFISGKVFTVVSYTGPQARKTLKPKKARGTG